MELLTCCLSCEGGGQEGGQYSCGGHAASGHYVTVSMVCCGLTVVCMLTRSRLSHHYSAAAAARRLAGRAGAGGGGGGEDRPLAPPARVTTTPTPPLVQTRTGAHFIMVTSPHPADTRHYGQTKNQDTLFSRCVEMERGPQGHPNSCQGWLRVVCVVMLWYDLGRDFYWCHQTIYNEDTR